LYPHDLPSDLLYIGNKLLETGGVLDEHRSAAQDPAAEDGADDAGTDKGTPGKAPQVDAIAPDHADSGEPDSGGGGWDQDAPGPTLSGIGDVGFTGDMGSLKDPSTLPSSGAGIINRPGQIRVLEDGAVLDGYD